MFTFNKEEREEKEFFTRKIISTTKMIWDLEFSRSKTRRIREEVRQQYDDMRAKMLALDEQTVEQAKNPTMEKGEIAKLDDQKVLFKKEEERLLEQIKKMDVEVNGSERTEEYKDGHIGLDEQIEAFRELIGDFKEYIKNI